MSRYATITIRRDSKLNWEVVNPRLELGEIGVDMTLLRFKVGNGIDKWNELSYMNEDLYSTLDKSTQQIAAIIEKIKRDNAAQVEFQTNLTNQFNAAKTAIDEGLANFEEKTEGLNARLDVIAGSATEDTEILDARVDALNTTHPNLGHNIRSIHKELLELSERQESRIEAISQELQENLLADEEIERSIRNEQDDGLQLQINKISEALINIVLEYQELRRKLTQP